MYYNKSAVNCLWTIKWLMFFISDSVVSSNTTTLILALFLISLVNNTKWPQLAKRRAKSERTQRSVLREFYYLTRPTNDKLPASENEPTVPLWAAVVGDTWEGSNQIWIFYLNYYKSRPFVVGQTSIRKLTSNLDKFRFDRHVLISYSVFNRNVQTRRPVVSTLNVIETWSTANPRIGDEQRKFLKFCRCV